MQLLQSVATYSYSIKKKGEQGGILLLILPWIVISLGLLSGLYIVGMQVESSIALEARLDICSLQTVQSRSTLLEYLTESNATLKKVDAVVTAMRSSAVIPIVGELSNIGEPALVELTNIISTSQQAKILEEGIREVKQLSCQTTNFSKVFAFCSFIPISDSQFHREPTLFPDIPGNISYNSQNLGEIQCAGSVFHKIYSSKIALKGDPQLLQTGFSYVYE